VVLLNDFFQSGLEFSFDKKLSPVKAMLGSCGNRLEPRILLSRLRHVAFLILILFTFNHLNFNTCYFIEFFFQVSTDVGDVQLEPVGLVDVD
jgi:hypothetical protein